MKYTEDNTLLKTEFAIFLTGMVAFAALHCLQPIIPVIGADLKLQPATASTLIAAGMLGMAGTLLLLTFFAECLPRKKFIVFGMFSCSILTLVLGQLPAISIMLLLRFLEGCVIALVPTLIMAYIQENLPEKKQAFLAGLYISGTTIGGLSGRLSVSFLTDIFHWRIALSVCGILLLLLAIIAALLLPKEQKRVHKQNDSSLEIFSSKHKKLFFLCFIGFTIMGNYVATCNFIAYDLKAAPYNFSQSIIGLIFLAQIFGSISSAASAKLVTRFGSVHVIAGNLLLMLAGILGTSLPAAVAKILGLCAINFALFGAHACLTTLCSKVYSEQKAASVAIYMFCYYLGASVIGSTGGIFFQRMGWNGIVLMVAILCLASLTVLYLFKKEYR